jgi:hypothetical protein
MDSDHSPKVIFVPGLNYYLLRVRFEVRNALFHLSFNIIDVGHQQLNSARDLVRIPVQGMGQAEEHL